MGRRRSGEVGWVPKEGWKESLGEHRSGRISVETGASVSSSLIKEVKTVFFPPAVPNSAVDPSKDCLSKSPVRAPQGRIFYCIRSTDEVRERMRHRSGLYRKTRATQPNEITGGSEVAGCFDVEQIQRHASKSNASLPSQRG